MLHQRGRERDRERTVRQRCSLFVHCLNLPPGQECRLLMWCQNLSPKQGCSLFMLCQNLPPEKGCSLVMWCQNLPPGQGCSLFMWCQNLPPLDFRAWVRPVYMASEPSRDCGVGVQIAYAVSEPISCWLWCSGAACLCSVPTYIKGIIV